MSRANQTHGASDISFCMIVRDAAAYLPYCLNSVVSFADEIVIVDTGSADDTRDIAQSFGATVKTVAWRDDFAAARNAYLRIARCSWVLSLDADEELGPVDGPALRQMLLRHPRTAFSLTVRNYFLEADTPDATPLAVLGGVTVPGVGFTVSRTVRLFPHAPGVEYRYPVHESLLPALRRQNIPVRPCAVPVHHMGYLYGRERASSKAAMYRRLSEKKLADHPDYFLAYLELGKFRMRDGDLDDAERLFGQCLALEPACARAHYYLAIVDLRRGDPVRALRRLQHAQPSRFAHGDVRQLRMLLERQLGGPDSARDVRSLLERERGNRPKRATWRDSVRGVRRQLFGERPHRARGESPPAEQIEQ